MTSRQLPSNTNQRSRQGDATAEGSERADRGQVDPNNVVPTEGENPPSRTRQMMFGAIAVDIPPQPHPERQPVGVYPRTDAATNRQFAFGDVVVDAPPRSRAAELPMTFAPARERNAVVSEPNLGNGEEVTEQTNGQPNGHNPAQGSEVREPSNPASTLNGSAERTYVGYYFDEEAYRRHRRDG